MGREGDSGGGDDGGGIALPVHIHYLENGNTGRNFNPKRSAFIRVELAEHVRTRGPHSSLAPHVTLSYVSGTP